ncbi:MAG: N-6 DNA methylase [Deltaproteobacteria bacterium]|nr:N-6 DNA methylase [Deltaproteobacteria bacterium]
MPLLSLKPTHKVIKSYYNAIANLTQLDLLSEGAVAPAFSALLRHCSHRVQWTLAEQFTIKRDQKSIRVDGALLDAFKLIHGVWEAKDTTDDLEKEIARKFRAGYPKENILFQAPDRVILYQNGQEVFNTSIARPEHLIEALEAFFSWKPPAYEAWERAVEEFKLKVPELGAGLLKLIEKERIGNKPFLRAFNAFAALCRQTLNPNLSDPAVEEMLIQHLLTERIFRKVFDTPDFVERNIIAHEIEKVIQTLTSAYFNRKEFLKTLDHFYGAIEAAAATIDDFSQKQAFLNTVYEKFFQGFSVKVADTHGIVYTPQPVVDFMVQSVQDILKKEFGRSLSDPGVHILDPFVGTGNFILRIMREIPRSQLTHKYASEIHCNEVMLLPYYIAAMNIEHAFYELTGAYKPFPGLCLVDTFELAEAKQGDIFAEENTDRILAQQAAPIFVIISNPPYNAGQVNENDNNKNRKYRVMDKRVADTYAKDSKATNKNALSDVYVKAIRWAADRIGDEGIVALITNNSFIDAIAFDGMRMHLAQDFSKIYHVNLKGNARTSGERRRQECGNVFDDAIRVSVGITFFVRKRESVIPAKAGIRGAGVEIDSSLSRNDDSEMKSPIKIFLYSVDDYLHSQDKKDILEKARDYNGIPFVRINPDKNHTWLTAGLDNAFGTFPPLGSKEGKAGSDIEVIFKVYSRGAETTRDAWLYNYNPDSLKSNVRKLIENYNTEVDRWNNRSNKEANLDDFVSNDNRKIKWSSRLKECLQRYQKAKYLEDKIRLSLYRPYCSQNLYFDNILVHRQGQFPSIFPSSDQEKENRIICVSGVGSTKPFQTVITCNIPSLDFLEKTQCFPFYTYNEDGDNRRENITDWALAQFREYYGDAAIMKWDIFHYIYALLHHPAYRETYAANLRRELPRIPFARDFRSFVEMGEKLAHLHVQYEEQSEHPLLWIENPDASMNWRVEKMKLTKDKTAVIVNDFLTLSGIPPAAFEYRLGNRSALEWIIDQYQVSADPRSGIVNDPNNPDDPQYIIRLIGKIITVSLEAVTILKSLPEVTIGFQAPNH